MLEKYLTNRAVFGSDAGHQRSGSRWILAVDAKSREDENKEKIAEHVRLVSSRGSVIFILDRGEKTAPEQADATSYAIQMGSTGSQCFRNYR